MSAPETSPMALLEGFGKTLNAHCSFVIRPELPQVAGITGNENDKLGTESRYMSEKTSRLLNSILFYNFLRHSLPDHVLKNYQMKTGEILKIIMGNYYVDCVWGQCI